MAEIGEVVRNPYPGLRPFRTDEEHLFFGRERQVDRMIAKLAPHRFLAVVGTSGSGKSSLVNCGLRPALHRGYMADAGAKWRMAQFRPGSDPIGALARALAAPGVLFDEPLTGALTAEDLVDSTLRLGSLGLVSMVEQADLPPDTQLLIVADQFEELFRFSAARRSADAVGGMADAAAFVRLLLEAAAQREVPIHVVLTMRSDFLGDCAQFHGLPEAINDGQYLVPRLTRDQIRAAITGPAGVQGAEISPLLVTRLLNDVGDNPDQLSILQHALNRTWAHWENEGGARGTIDLPHYEAIGGMADALNRHAEKAYGELPDDASRRLCEKVFKALTDTGTDARGVRRMTRLSTLCAITGATQDELKAVFRSFRKPSRSFLMPPKSESLRPDSAIDISHESLMRVWKRLACWADEEAQSARIFRELRDKAAQQASLWRGPELGIALAWQQQNAPTLAWAELYGGGFDAAMKFLDASRQAQDEERLEAEIARRWNTGWHYLPLALVGIPFIALQIYLQDNTVVRGFFDMVIEELPRDVGRVLGSLRVPAVASHVIAGIPAVLIYFAVAPVIRRIFDTRARADIRLQAAPATAPRAAAADTRLKLDPQTTARGGFWRRAGAEGVDWLLGLMLTVLVAAMAAFLLEDVLKMDADAAVLPLIGAITLSFLLYHLLTWSSRWQATPGMRLAGLVLTDLQGRRIGRMRGSVRFLARIVSYYLLGLGFLMQPFNAQRQTLHDRLAGTLVLQRDGALGGSRVLLLALAALAVFAALLILVANA